MSPHRMKILASFTQSIQFSFNRTIDIIAMSHNSITSQHFSTLQITRTLTHIGCNSVIDISYTTTCGHFIMNRMESLSLLIDVMLEAIIIVLREKCSIAIVARHCKIILLFCHHSRCILIVPLVIVFYIRI